PRSAGPPHPRPRSGVDGGRRGGPGPPPVAYVGTPLRRPVRGVRRRAPHSRRVGRLVLRRRTGGPGGTRHGPRGRPGLSLRPSAAPGVQRGARPGVDPPLPAGRG